MQAKDAAKVQDKWLLVNLQSTREFSSHMLNRDTWGNEAVAQTIRTNFIFWQGVFCYTPSLLSNHSLALANGLGIAGL
ncbi:unnamed protein product [Ilex paraguariensis]|uniref:Uncharacterized protein n=1 Tax=Ilex paraguariensis TaxID=185542 RepID=A0ABC8R9S9_9AQUA